MPTPETPLPPKYAGLRPLPMLIFGSRWLQLPLYVGLIAAQGVYVIIFLKELWHLSRTPPNSTSSKSSCWCSV
jgi:uncharacterized membrane protein YqhA